MATAYYDVAVIGGGTAGSVLAARLSENPDRTVVLVEAGADFSDLATLPDDLKWGFSGTLDAPTSPYHWNAETRATSSSRKIFAGGRVLGGGSAINGQVFLRPLIHDFTYWTELGNDEWSYDRALPALIRLEHDLDVAADYHGAGGPIPVHRSPQELWPPSARALFAAAQERGYEVALDLNAPGATGVGACPFNNVDGHRISAAVAYLGPARGRENLTIRCGVTAHRLRLSGRTVIGVEVVEDGIRTEISAEQFVLTAGAIGSPKLLLLSGIGPAGDLRSLGIPVAIDLPGVGQGLRDHPMAITRWRGKSEPARDRDLPRGAVRLRRTCTESPFADDMMISMYSQWDGPPGASTGPGESFGFMLSPHLMLAASKGSVTLRSVDPADSPVIDFNYLSEKTDVIRLRDGIRECAALTGTDAFAKLEPMLLSPGAHVLQSDDTLDQWLMDNVQTTYHATSTCRMGRPADPDTVVDQYGRMTALDNLRIADASILPDCPRANVNAPTIMLAERISDFINLGQ